MQPIGDAVLKKKMVFYFKIYILTRQVRRHQSADKKQKSTIVKKTN